MRGYRGIGRRELLRAAGLVGLSGLCAPFAVSRSDAATDTTPEPLNIVNLQGNFTAVLDNLIKSGGYFQQVGLDVTIANVTDGSKVIAALISGHGDFCAGSGFSGVFPAIEKGAKIKIIGGAMMRPQNAIFSKRADVISSKDLIGKTVGIGPLGALLHQLAVGLMIKQGVDYTKVNFRNVGSAVDVFKAVVAGSVDAGFGNIDVFDQQEKYGVHVLTDGVLWDELPNFTNQAMIASDSAIAEKRDQLVKALAAHAKLYRFIASPNSKEAWFKARAASLSTDNPQEAETQWKFFNTPGMLGTNLVLTPEQFDLAQQLNVTLGAQGHVLPFDQVADMSIAQDALKLLG